MRNSSTSIDSCSCNKVGPITFIAVLPINPKLLNSKVMSSYLRGMFMFSRTTLSSIACGVHPLKLIKILYPRKLFFFELLKPWKFHIFSALSFLLCNENLNSFITKVRTLFKGRNYSREEIIHWNMIFKALVFCFFWQMFQALCLKKIKS